MQDFTGVPCIVDLATMREAMADLGGDATKINPLAPAEMVIDHSVMVDAPAASTRSVAYTKWTAEPWRSRIEPAVGSFRRCST